MKKIKVIKFNGEEELFSDKKVYQSAKRVGASDQLAREISRTIEKEVYPGMKTSQIFSLVKKKLKQETPRAALRFNLKKAIRRLGPTGFPFEKYMGEVFASQGFKVLLNQEIVGACVSYEIDFLAQKNNLLYIGECKYRNLRKGRVHSRDALANHARFLDIEKGSFSKNKKIKSLLVTNTKFTTKVIKYSQCVGVELLGWRFPKNRGLEQLIESQKLYPITILPGLNKYLAERFSQKGIMLAKDLLDRDRVIRITKIPEKQLRPLVKQAQVLF